MIEINLLPWRERRRARRARAFLAALAASAAAAIGAVALIGIEQAAAVAAQAQRNGRSEAGLRELHRQLAEIDALRERAAERAQRAQTLRRLASERFRTVEILGGLAAAAVPGAAYTRIDIGPRHVAAAGTADSSDRVGALLRSLQAAGGAPGLRHIAADPQTGTVAFELTLDADAIRDPDATDGG